MRWALSWLGPSSGRAALLELEAWKGKYHGRRQGLPCGDGEDVVERPGRFALKHSGNFYVGQTQTDK